MRLRPSRSDRDDHVIRRRMKQRRAGGAALSFHYKKVPAMKRLLGTGHALWVLCGLIGIWVFCRAIVCHIGGGEEHPSVRIFAAPRPFSSLSSYGGGSAVAMQELAVRSWLALSPDVTVVLFSSHHSVDVLAESLGPRVSVEHGIDFTFLGTPFFHSMISRSQVSNSDISVLVDPETVLLPDFLKALYHAYQLDNDWFLVSLSSNISHFPFHLDVTNTMWLNEREERTDSRKLVEFIKRSQHSNTCGERVILAWNTGSVPLHAGVLPPFLYRRGAHDQWLINEVLLANFRLVIDASEAISSFYTTIGNIHDSSSWSYASSSNEGNDSKQNWERNCNRQLASVYGSFYFLRRMSQNFLRLIKFKDQYMFIDTRGNLVQKVQYTTDAEPYGNDMSIRNQENAGFLKHMNQPPKTKKWRACIKTKNACSLTNLPKVDCRLPVSFLLPFSLNQLLEMVADENNTIILAVAGVSYRDMLMSWVCRLRHLSVKNFVIAALDMETYEFSVLQGLPVFLDLQSPSNISFNNCHFGSGCFPRVTKVKSRLVLHIVKQGYNVLLSDVDVYWFENPLPYLFSFGPATLVAQSDEYNETGPINLPRRLNSGFYFVHSDSITILALEKVVKHASVSELSEQPSFYDVLCGVGGLNRVGDDRCIEPETNLTVHFLERDMFPNGAYQGLWEKDDVGSACRKKGCVILHNNWIAGRERKLERQLVSGLWAYSSSSRMCLQG